MPRPSVKERKFITYPTDKFLYETERTGKAYTVDSGIFHSVGYSIFPDSIAVAAGKNGNISIGINDIEDFAKELIEIAEMAKERKKMGCKGA